VSTTAGSCRNRGSEFEFDRELGGTELEGLCASTKVVDTLTGGASVLF